MEKKEERTGLKKEEQEKKKEKSVQILPFVGSFQFSSLKSPKLSARTSRTILKSYGESGQPCLVPDFRGIALSFSPFSLMMGVGLLYIAFIMFRYVPVIPNLSKTFIMKGYWILSKDFQHLSK
ncbi:hypothetical protein H671_7g18369 [Cricetulus griseus]|uniref:Uncharacterized protein n=1 Tax=Cricetulus griseus TaxID=10029 RepID=A0A061I0E8_CRIGR|nr:hypothetical protein H671_7g18369 [Cricetulus griseus]